MKLGATVIVGLLAIMLAACGSNALTSGAGIPKTIPAGMSGTWIEAHPSVAPPARWMGAMAYDAAIKTIVLFGGQSDVPGAAALGDTWTWNGTIWTEQRPPISPPGRWGASMAYDPRTQTVVLFGGEATTSANRVAILDGTWTWNGTIWTEQRPPISPPGRAESPMSYDPTSGTDLLFGGIGASGRLGDTWTWNGEDWTQLHSRVDPPPLANGSLSADITQRTVLLFGGAGSNLSEPLSSATWTWSAADWSNRSDAIGPSARDSTAMSTLGNRGVLLFGGSALVGPLGPRGDSWLWAKSSWWRLSPRNSPPGREGATMVYDEATGTAVLFGGSNPFLHKLLGDTWIYQPQ